MRIPLLGKTASVDVLDAEGWKETWLRFQNKTVDYVSDPGMWMAILFTVVKILILLIVGRLIIKLADKIIDGMLEAREKGPIHFSRRRTETIGKLVRNIVTYVVNFILILMILSQFNVNLGPVLAGAGVLGLAIGFGAQSLVKDVITGFFIIFEDQFAVGDVIQVGTYKGTVEEIGLRVTRIKSWTGEIHILPNGTINQVTNFSVNNSLAVIDVNVTYETDIDQAIQILRETADAYYEKSMDIVKEPQVLGVQTMGVSEITLRLTAECKPNAQFGVSRDLYSLIKKAFESSGIQIPYPRVVTYHRNEKAEL
ncbi:mechanosensitive ion channel family protein [Paenibacillus mucilaginosus]|uniref:Mechanosensitive ion channel family protein n=2 Tax=Paenibacillus mucilaginosus TaxID=61624 RepID=H6NIZ0_9BACL|nr:mechanosensitive ion channel family protein [Paenibacillus mucilaginosus]AEI46446.1 mechanosensitive ion channel family protein [Paenibacillus mucilaginosus KNP414]AFC34040.1 mechanosensitive ion channel family protein [Paenibacillus mucilaginosus 3016]MCG7213449.1 mechanosensitive ion channel family protein [Paenibacillus mucilaginosus]WDM27732.1 mechanosensitive ion channel family protein [Paenibacillus mucilaginosus]WFA22405.1 mechanosensitive ion channel family protein [Paenibacillus mu